MCALDIVFENYSIEDIIFSNLSRNIVVKLFIPNGEKAELLFSEVFFSLVKKNLLILLDLKF